MKLTAAERLTLLNQLFEEAQEQCRAVGCTCTPTWTLTPHGIGPHDLKAWISHHDAGCAAAACLTLAAQQN